MDASTLIFLIERVSNIFELICGYFFVRTIDCCLTRREGKLPFVLGVVGYSAVASLVIFPQDMVNVTLVMVVFLILNFVLYKGKWIIKFSLVMILLPISAALNLLVTDVTGHLFFLRYTVQDELENTFFSTLSFLLVVLFWTLFYRLFHLSFQKMRNLFTNRAWGIIDIICLASFAGLFSCIYLSPEQASYLIWPCILACVVTNIGSIRLASYLADGIHADLERKNLQLQQNYYRELENNQNLIRKLRHDMNSHLAVVGQLLDRGDAKEASAYFEKISGYMQSANRRFCRNSIVNAVLNAKYNLMVENEIDGFFNVSIDKMVLIDDISLCTIFANTLDNAIEACNKIPDSSKRRLQLKCRYTDSGYFSFELENAKQNPVTVSKGRYISDKREKNVHGIGISSVKDIVDRYEGTFNISYDQNSFRVVILIG